jgi:hypothetical protein
MGTFTIVGTVMKLGNRIFRDCKFNAWVDGEQAQI